MEKPKKEKKEVNTGQLPPSATITNLFGNPWEGQETKKLSLPPIIKPADLAGNVIAGTIEGVRSSPVATFKSDLLLMAHPSGTKFCLPLTAVIKRALATELVERGHAKKTDEADITKAIGIKLLVRGLGKVATQDKKRTVNLFEIEIVK